MFSSILIVGSYQPMNKREIHAESSITTIHLLREPEPPPLPVRSSQTEDLLRT
jgi:hypothetical protein